MVVTTGTRWLPWRRTVGSRSRRVLVAGAARAAHGYSVRSLRRAGGRGQTHRSKAGFAAGLIMDSVQMSFRLPRIALALALAAALAAPGTTAAGRSEPIVAAFAPLSGIVIALDPGHNGGNAAHAAEIRQPVWIGNGYKPCNQVGTSTVSGYPEHAFTFDVALRVKAS